MGEIKDIDVAQKMLQLNQSASSRKLGFDLSFRTVKFLLSQKKCYYTGIEFEETVPNSRSIDRIDSSLGYVEGNVVACTVDINGKKGALTIKEIESIYKGIQKKKSASTNILNFFNIYHIITNYASV